MADLPPYPNSGDDADRGPNRESTANPRWTKVFIVVFGVLFLVVLILHLAGGGFRH